GDRALSGQPAAQGDPRHLVRVGEDRWLRPGGGLHGSTPGTTRDRDRVTGGDLRRHRGETAGPAPRDRSGDLLAPRDRDRGLPGRSHLVVVVLPAGDVR